MGTRLADAATEQALRCPICWDEMVAPTVTPCGHAFCEKHKTDASSPLGGRPRNLLVARSNPLGIYYYR